LTKNTHFVVSVKLSLSSADTTGGRPPMHLAPVPLVTYCSKNFGKHIPRMDYCVSCSWCYRNGKRCLQPSLSKCPKMHWFQQQI